MQRNQRDGERLPILGELPGEIVVYQPMVVTEIGRGGVTVETRFPLHLNSLHDLRLVLGEQSVVLKGRVAHSAVSDMDQEAIVYRSGLEFIEPPEHVAAAIAGYVETLRTSRTGV